jgi:hypothetical protein
MPVDLPPDLWALPPCGEAEAGKGTGAEGQNEVKGRRRKWRRATEPGGIFGHDEGRRMGAFLVGASANYEGELEEIKEAIEERGNCLNEPPKEKEERSNWANTNATPPAM